MDTIEQFFVLIHPDFNRLGYFLNHGLWYLDPSSYQLYLSMKQRQDEIIQDIVHNEKAVLFVLPPALDYVRKYARYDAEGRNLIKSQLLQLIEWERLLKDRFVLMDEEDFEEIVDLEPSSDRSIKELNLRLRDVEFFTERFRFTFSPAEVKMYAFGEYASNCVTQYGDALSKSLDIHRNNFQILYDASVENVLEHESDINFYKKLKGWGKERG